MSSDFRIEKDLGKPLNFSLKNAQILGSTFYYVKSFKAKEISTPVHLEIDSRCSFQKYDFGLLLYSTKSSSTTKAPIPYRAIKRVELIKGVEVIKPLPLSLMGIMLKLGVPLNTARYFKSRFNEYTIEDMILHIHTDRYEVGFIANGHTFESQLKFFQSIIPPEILSVVYR